jgi:hypothetical protein
MKYLTLLGLFSILTVSACGLKTDINQQTAHHIAMPAFMVERTIAAGPFGLNAWERMHQRGTTATVYIEGDSPSSIDMGDEKVNFDKVFGSDASVSNPLALQLAARDLSENLAYIGRPCQSVKMPAEKGCNPKYWGMDRFAPEVMNSYHAALDDIAARWDITKFHIVGFGGGANIAAVMAATRNDILSLRTVAGDLNPAYGGAFNMPLSDNAVLATHYGAELATIPQHHFIGGSDEVITTAHYQSYRQALGGSDCIHYSVIPEVGHMNGWVQIWPQLLGVEPKCAVVHDLDGDLPPLLDFPGNYHKGKGSKGGKYNK